MASKNLNGKRCQKNGASILLAVMYNNFPYIAIIQQIINRKLKYLKKYMYFKTYKTNDC